MSRRYDSRTTIFSPEGRLFQVEYAVEAISNAGATIGILTKEGVAIIAEKRILSKLLDTKAVGVRREKIHKLDDHISCSVAGLTADANILINKCRLSAQQYLLSYQEPMPVEQLARNLSDLKQGYTQFGGQRPFGVSMLIAGWDEHFGWQLYMTNPSGNYGGWHAMAIGSGNQVANNLLKTDYRDDLSLDEAIALAARILQKSIDQALTPERLELATLTRDAESGKVLLKIFEEAEIKPVVEQLKKETEEAAAAGGSGAP